MLKLLRKISALLLLANLFISIPASLFASEAQAAGDSVNFMCPDVAVGAVGELSANINTSEDKKTLLEEKQKILTKAAEHKGTCGEDLSGYFFKGDCSREKKVITEISEIMAPNVETSVGKVIDLYRGSCCQISEPASSGPGLECAQEAAFYAKDFATCKKSSFVPCEHRQWLIAESGTGVLQVYAKQVYTYTAFAVGAFAVTTITFAGVQISISGSSGDISAQKEKISQAILAIVLLFMSGLILYIVNPSFFS